MVKKHLKLLSAVLAFLLFTSLWIPPVQASYRRSSLETGGFSAIKVKSGKVCYLSHKTLGSLMLLDHHSVEAKQQRQEYLERLLGVYSAARAFELFRLYQPIEVGRYYDDYPALISSGVPEEKGRTWVLPILPLSEEKAKGTSIAAVQMLLNYRQAYHSQDELAKLLKYHVDTGVDFKKIPAVLNQELWGYEKPKNLTQAGYRLETLGKNKKENVKLFEERLYDDIFKGYPLLAEIKGKAGLQIDRYDTNFSRTVIVIGYLLKQGDDGGIEGVYYIEPQHLFQKLFWGGLHYLPLEDFVDAVSESESQSYIW